MRRKHILFVDDDAAILGSLNNLLRKERQRWDMTFALGADQALVHLATAPVDVIVSDMRMPGMDGAALLAKVKSDYPATARIVLSGFSDRASIMRALPVAHQFLSKPCEPMVLRAAIERTCELHQLLQNASLRALVGSLGSLHTVPRSYTALMDAANDPNAGIRDFADIVERDPALGAKVLQLVNSAYFGCAQRVVSIQKAVSYLGLELLTSLALTEQIFTVCGERPIEGFSLDAVQESVLATARLAKKLLSNPERAEEAYTAALLHDVGKLVFAIGRREEFTEVVREVAESGRTFAEVEQEVFGVTHAEVGAYLLGIWGLPFSIVECVAFHHRPGLVSEGSRDVLAAVHVADALIDASNPCDRAEVMSLIDCGFIDSAGLSSELARWCSLGAAQPRGDRHAA